MKNAREAEELKQDMAKAPHREDGAVSRRLFLSCLEWTSPNSTSTQPLPEIKTNGMQSLLRTFQSAGPQATLRDIATGIHTFTLVGTADAVAGQMQEAMEEIGGDGFLVQGHIKPKYVHSITDELVPALQKRGLTRTEYTASTLRETLMGILIRALVKRGGLSLIGFGNGVTFNRLRPGS